MSQEGTEEISAQLREFYASHNVPIDHFLATPGNKSTTSSRFIRFNPRHDNSQTLSRLKTEIESETGGDDAYLIAVPWLDKAFGFYALPGSFSLSQSACYREGRIYGMDISSGAAVAALLSDQHDNIPEKMETNASEHGNSQTTAEDGVVPLRVLDLCCAPGLKLCAMADYLSSTKALKSTEQQEHIIVGVDISESRLATCKRIIQKYHIDPETSGNQEDEGANHVRMRLYRCDGTTFHKQRDLMNDNLPALTFDSSAAMEELAAHGGKRKRMNKSARARERKRLKQLGQMDFIEVPKGGDDGTERPSSDNSQTPQQSSFTTRLFDFVLVDAECSTDGSLKHIRKSSANQGKSAGVHQLVDSEELSKLVQLQQQLAASGFRLLMPGGTMVYSTCSLSYDQNESVVEWLLKEFPMEAFITPVHFSISDQDSHSVGRGMISHGDLGVRFHPGMPSSQTCEANTNDETQFFGGGFFLAKIGKRHPKKRETGPELK